MQTAGRKFPVHIVVFLLPPAAIYTLFMVYPLLDSLRLSFFDQSNPALPVFVGLANFQTLLGDPSWSARFWNALGNNLVFFSIHMLVQNPLALLLATLFTVKKLRGRAIYRTLIFAPTTLSVVIIGFIWSLILSPIWGHIQQYSERDRPGITCPAVAWCIGDISNHGQLDLRLAICRSADDPVHRCTAQYF